MPDTSLAFHLRNDILTDRSVSIPEMIMVQSTNAASGMVPPAPGGTAILDAALRLFAERGFDGTSMRQVSEAAGVSKANIYHHFESKEALYIAVLRSSVADTRELLKDLADPTERFETRVARYARAHLAHIFEHAMASRLILREALAGDESQARTLADQVVGENFRQLIAILHEGQRAGVLKADIDPALCATLLVGANVFFFQAQSVLRHITEVTFATDPERYSEGIIDVLLHGMLDVAGPAKKRRG